MCLFPKNENTLALRTIWATNFGLVPKTRNIYLEEKQSGIWWWVASSDERRRKQERETCTVTLRLLSWNGSGNLGVASSRSYL